MPEFKIHVGDCLQTMRAMPDNSVDSVVTDPPYGLSSGSTKGVADRLADALLDVVLPDLYDANVQMGRMGEFSGPRDSVSFLDFMLRAAREEPGVAVPESAVDFQGYVANQKVEHAGEGACLASDGILPNEFVAHGCQFGSNFILQLRHNGDAPLRDGVRGLFREQGAGRICVPVVIAQNSSFSRFLGALCPALPSFLGDLVGFCNGAGGVAGSSSSIVAGWRAEISAVLALDSRNGSIELLPANAAFQGEIVFEVCAAQPVRASTGAGGLPAKFEPRTVGVVGDSANRAATFHFHKALLEAMDFSRKGFMGKEWDGNVPSIEIWAECLRVLKPGGHLLAFAGTRTQHRMAVRIEDAGFEIRDMIAWVYGSGFPKSMSVSKAIDKAAGADRELTRPGVVRREGYGDDWDKGDSSTRPRYDIPATDEAAQWEGWGTALKPALEPITVARKPFKSTVAANVLEFGTGALNIDACRVTPTGERLGGGDESGKAAKPEGWARPWMDSPDHVAAHNAKVTSNVDKASQLGRWPANLIHDGSPEVIAAFPDAPGQLAAASTSDTQRAGQNCYGTMKRGRASEASSDSENGGIVGFQMKPGDRRLDTGSAARFFYCAKTSRTDRHEGMVNPGPQFKMGTTLRKVETTETKGNNHPTVKPTDLMAYLLRLVTPPGGVALDPFMGSGSTGKAAMREGFEFIGCEIDEQYAAIARARIEFEVLRQQEQKVESYQLNLFATA